MTRLRRYLPVIAYFAAFTTVVVLQDEGVIQSDIPGTVFGGFGLGWLLVFIWRNRDGGPKSMSLAERPNLDPYDPMSLNYQSTGTDSIQYDSRSFDRS